MTDNDQTNRPPGPPDKRTVAVALSAGPDRSSIPKVTAAAHGELAEKLLEIAFANGVPVREDADLAEIIAALEVESDIPVAAFAAIAEILSYVYRLNGDPSAGPDRPLQQAWQTATT